MQFEPSTSRHGNPADWNIPPQLSRFTNRQISVCLLEEIPKMAKYGARTKSGKPCRSPATKKGRCRLHGGASGSGGPAGERNGQYRHGERTKGAIAERHKFIALLKVLRAGLT
jgi:hypothetical protein